MKIRNEKVHKRQKRHRHVRRNIFGSPEKPRLCVFRSSKHIYAQIVDDTVGRTLVAASSLKIGPVSDAEAVDADKEKNGKKAKKAKKGKKASTGGKKTAEARQVGRLIAEAAKEKGISEVCFDRGGFLYHGRVAALAGEARKNGLKF
jgi:large subunit ribosomal protein L18